MSGSIKRAICTRLTFVLCTLFVSLTICTGSAFANENPHAKMLDIEGVVKNNNTAMAIEAVKATKDPAALEDIAPEHIFTSLTQDVNAVKASSLADESLAAQFFFAQSRAGRCTITAAAMMVRRAAYLDNNKHWQDITEESVADDGWCGAGIMNSFSTAGYHVHITSVEGTHEGVISLLEEHPEGVAIYDPGVPHALFLTDYDAKNDTFYCADPAGYYAGRRIPVADSWNGERHGHDQDAVISGFSSAWVIER